MSHRSKGLFAVIQSALLVGIFLGGLLDSGHAAAKRSMPDPNAVVRKPVDARGNGKHQGQSADRCDTDDDCNQSSSRPLTCQTVGEQKQCKLKPGTILPPT